MTQNNKKEEVSIAEAYLNWSKENPNHTGWEVKYPLTFLTFFISQTLEREREAKKCECCEPEDEHIDPEDRSTTRISRPCSGCGKHQTIAGALLKSKYWHEWYDHASKNMLYDVDETLMIDAMSDEHFEDFIKFTILNNKHE